jgi:hypothetical protein
MRLSIIYYLLFISSTTIAQDSLRFVPVRAWQLSKLIDDAKLSRSCDSAMQSTIKAWHSTENSLTLQTKVLNEVTISRNEYREKSEAQTLLLKNNEAQQKIDLKLGKAKARKFGFVCGIGVLVIVEALRLH